MAISNCPLTKDQLCLMEVRRATFVRCRFSPSDISNSIDIPDRYAVRDADTLHSATSKHRQGAQSLIGEPDQLT